MSWWLIVLMAGITFSNRALFLVDVVPYQPGPKLKKFLSYSAYAVLTAIWVPVIFSIERNTITVTGVDYLVGATVAAVLTVGRVPAIWVVLLSISVFSAIRFLG